MKNPIWVFVSIYILIVGGYAVHSWVYPLSQQARAAVIKETRDSVTAIVITETMQRGEVLTTQIDTVRIPRDLKDVILK